MNSIVPHGNRRLSRACLSLRLVGGLCLFLMTGPGRATERIWNGSGGDSHWSTPENWGGTAPVVTGVDGVRFAGSSRPDATNDFENAVFNKITFDANASPFILSGSSIQLGTPANGIRNASSVEQKINLDIELFSAGSYVVGTAGTGALTINGVLSGAGGVGLLGTQVVSLNGANRFTGGLTVGSGNQLRLGNATAAGSGTLTVSGGTVAFGGGIGNFSTGNLAGSVAFALTDELGQGVTLSLTGGAETSRGGALTGTGALKVALQAGGKQILTGANTYTGGTTIDSGTLELSGGSAALAGTGALTINGGALIVSRTAAKALTVSSLNGTGGEIVANTGSVGTPADTTLTVNTTTADRFDGSLKDGVGTLVLTKAGTGTLTLGGTSSYTGTTAVNAGLLKIAGSLTASNVVVKAGAALGGNGGAIGNSVTVNTGGALNFTLNDPSETNLRVGSLSLGANVDLKLALNFAAQPGQTFTILGIDGSFTGAFATVNGEAFGAGDTFSLQYGPDTYDFKMSYTPNAVSMAVVPEPNTFVLLALAGGFLGLGRKGCAFAGKARRRKMGSGGPQN